MASTPVALPARAWFKASEVCDLAQVQPFILRSWEKEFPDLGVAKTPGGPRLYRKADVARVLQIKDLLFVDGLTLAGARRRLEESKNEAPADIDLSGFLTEDLRLRLGKVKAGLTGLLTLLDGGRAGESASSETTKRSGAPKQPASAADVDFSLSEPAAVKRSAVRKAPPRRSPSRSSRAATPAARRRRA